MIVDGLIAAALIHNAGGVSVDLPNNSRLTLLTTPTPTQVSPSSANAIRPSPTEIENLPSVDREAESKTARMVSTETPTTKSVQPVSFTIVNRQFAVPAGQFVFFRFTLAAPSRVTGQFQAYGGKNDIAVAVMSEDEFPAYKNGGYYRAYYNTDYITADTPTFTLPPGTYYLAFDDRKALIIGKTVVARFIVSP